MTTLYLQSVLNDVEAERNRQEKLREAGKFGWTAAELFHKNKLIACEEKLAVLSEEFGEVARLVAETVIERSRRNPRELKKELIQVAAVAIAWCEAIDRELDVR